jgi:hypothetical protein
MSDSTTSPTTSPTTSFAGVLAGEIEAKLEEARRERDSALGNLNAMIDGYNAAVAQRDTAEIAMLDAQHAAPAQPEGNAMKRNIHVILTGAVLEVIVLACMVAMIAAGIIAVWR